MLPPPLSSTRDKMSYVIYMHRNKINGKVYIGQTCQNLNKRWQNGKGYEKCILFYNAIQKYGFDGFDHEILFEVETKEEADEKEIEMIAYYDSTNRSKGYNLTEGGGGTSGYHLTEERKRRISESQTGRLLTEEWKQHISESIKGEKAPWYGKTFSEEHRKRLSESHIGKPSAMGMLGKKQSEEAKRKISNANIGKHHSEKSKEKMRQSALNSRGRLFFCVELNHVFDNLNEAHETTSCPKSAIVLCCQGKQFQSKGYHWEYAD